jgi:NitT/TauT family transport system substrate-binding protein
MLVSEKRRLLLLGMAASVLLAWPYGSQAQIRLKAAYPTTVGSMAVLWVAKEARLFDKHGLDVDLIYIAGSSKVVQAMLAKEVPFAEIAIPAVIQANAAGADLVMLAGPNHKPGQKIMVKPEIQNPEDLKGRKLGVTRFGTSDDFLLRYILAQWGLKADREVALIQMGGSQEILAGLGSRAIDGGMLSSPLHLRAPNSALRCSPI